MAKRRRCLTEKEIGELEYVLENYLCNWSDEDEDNGYDYNRISKLADKVRGLGCD